MAYAAWTAIYAWIFKSVPAIMFMAPFLSIATLVAMHILFRVTWETFWYDKLDKDPNTDSPLWVPLLIITLLLSAEVMGMYQFLAGQVAPVVKESTAQIDESHSTTLSAYNQSWQNDKQEIENIFKQKETAAALRYDRAIRNLVEKVSDTPADRAYKRKQIASLRAQRDMAVAPVLEAKAAAIEKAWHIHSENKNSEVGRRKSLISQVDTKNLQEEERYASQMGSIGYWSVLISIVLLLLIGGLSYRTVKINVTSNIIPLHNYTVLDAHGGTFERLWLALSDAWDRRTMQFSVWLHKALSPKKALTSFDGNVISRPGTYNTPSGFYPTGMTEDELRGKVAAKLFDAASKDGLQVTPELIAKEFELAKQHNGSYKDLPIGGGKKTEASPVNQAQPVQATPTPSAPSYAELLTDWKRRVENQLRHHDKQYKEGEYAQAKATNAYIFTEPTSSIVKEGKRLDLEWGVKDGVLVVRRLDRDHYVPLEDLSESALNTPTPSQPGKTGKTVTQNTTSVTQINVQADDVVKFHMTELQREPSNYRNKHAENASVASRVEKKLRSAIQAIEALPEHSVSWPVGTALQRFVMEKLPTTYPYLDDSVAALHKELGSDLYVAIIGRLQERKMEVTL